MLQYSGEASTDTSDVIQEEKMLFLLTMSSPLEQQKSEIRNPARFVKCFEIYYTF